jgi:hypothetical protein
LCVAKFEIKIATPPVIENQLKVVKPIIVPGEVSNFAPCHDKG